MNNQYDFVFITGNRYPEGDAGAVRQHAMAKMLQKMGKTPLVLACSDGGFLRKNTYDGVDYVTFKSGKQNVLSKAYDREVFVKRAINYLKRNSIIPKNLLLVDASPKSYRWLKKFSSDYGVQLLHDAVEWYSPEEFPMGKWDFWYRRKEYTNKKGVDKHFHVVSISRFFDEYFKGKGIVSERIPVIMDTANIKYNTSVSQKERVVIVYAGSPTKKDYIREVVEGLSRCNLKEKLEFHAVGIKKEQLEPVCGIATEVIKKCGDSLVCHGRVNREEALEFVRNADYSILVRDENLRYAKAGFPTKVVESLASGTPVICNYSSDLELYLKDGENSVIINGHSVEAVSEALDRVAKMPHSEEMRVFARKTAEEHFDYSCYYEKMNNLIS